MVECLPHRSGEALQGPVLGAQTAATHTQTWAHWGSGRQGGS